MEADYSATDGPAGSGDLPVKVVEEVPSSHKMPLMDALQDAMQEMHILPPSASTLALSALVGQEQPKAQQQPIRMDDPLSSAGNRPPLAIVIGQEEEEGLVDIAGHQNQNSFPPAELLDGGGEVHGGCLTTDDLDRIQTLVNEFCLKALLPHFERQMRLLNEAVSARKSARQSLLSATKRWFGSNKPPGGGAGQPTQTVAVSYHPESAQLQTRRLGDLAFLAGHYELAYASYHAAKKDFEADQAWLHYAGAAEMAALSVFLQAGGRQVPFHYFESALTAYLQTCKMPNWATRCAVLASECLKASGLFNDAALQLIRLTSEDADLRSAVLLEQAALCFLRTSLKSSSSADPANKAAGSPLIRKYAFHMILAGHRFGKSGQKRHASRAYQLALQVYRGHGWSLAEDHIHYTVGRQCLNGQQVEGASKALAALLKPGSQQTAAQQSAYLGEFIHVNQLMVKQQLAESSDPLPILPLPLVDGQRIRVLVETRESVAPGEASHVTLSDDEVHQPKWAAMEERLVQCGLGTSPALFRPSQLLFSESTNNAVQPQTFCDELVSVEIPLTNPLRIPILLTDVRLLWRFSGPDGQLDNHQRMPASQNNNNNPVVATFVIPKILVSPNATSKVVVTVKPKAEGNLTLDGLAFDLRPAPSADPSTGLTPCVTGRVELSVRGPRLNSTLQERNSRIYAPDKRLSILVGPAMPRLRVTFRSWPEFLFSGEVRRVQVELANDSNVPVSNILMASNDPVHLTAPDLQRVDGTIQPAASHQQQQQQASAAPPVAVYRWDVARKSATLWLRGSDSAGLNALDLVFFYQANPAAVNRAKYRTVRHCTKVFVSSSLSLQAWVQRVPGPVTSSEALSVQLQMRNLRDADDTSLSGIEIRQVALLSDRWHLRPSQSVLPVPLGCVIHPQESLVCALLAARDGPVKSSKGTTAGSNGYCESVSLMTKGSPVDFQADPYRALIRELHKGADHSTLAVSWTVKNLLIFCGRLNLILI